MSASVNLQILSIYKIVGVQKSIIASSISTDARWNLWFQCQKYAYNSEQEKMWGAYWD